jgi:hypothetical protein
MEEINVQLLNMDTKIPEQLIKNDDDSYTIFLNARLSQESRIKSYYHALKHIHEQDFEKDDLQKIELNAHKILQE